MRHAAALMFVPTVLFGMSFPVLTHLVTKGSKDIGGSLGAVYGMNTLGGITGSIFAGYLLLPNLGSQQTSELVCPCLTFYREYYFLLSSSLFTSFIRKGVAISLSCCAFLVCIDKCQTIFLRDIFFCVTTHGKKNPEQLIYLDEGLTTTVAIFNKDDSGGELKSSKRLILNGD